MLKKLEIMYSDLVLEYNQYLVFLNITKVADFRWKNADFSRTQRGVSRDFYIFGSFLGMV